MTPTEAHSDAVQRLNPPRQRQVAVMFADLDHFTRICAEDPPHRVFRLVRDFHHVVTESVARCKGRLNAYLGDGAMATFGDGQGRIDCATRALRCALTILEQIVALNQKLVDAGRRPVSISLGLQYGQALVGSITSSKRFGPTVIGDTVNVANRLEQRARALSAKIVVGDDLVQRARRESGPDSSELAQLVHLGPLAVDGRSRPVDVWILSTLMIAHHRSHPLTHLTRFERVMPAAKSSLRGSRGRDHLQPGAPV
jgi:adenylate cyclase